MSYKSAVNLIFFHNNLKKKINSTMTSTINIQSFDSEILYNSEESVVPNSGSNSFLNDVLEKVFEEEGETRIKREPKHKLIHK